MNTAIEVIASAHRAAGDIPVTVDAAAAGTRARSRASCPVRA